MLYTYRIWSVSEVESAEELARMLTEMSWGCCHAFCIKGHSNYVWVNDSTAPDRLQEYAVLKLNNPDGEIMQIESITFSWCDEQQALQFINGTLAGKDDNNFFAGEVRATLQTSTKHDRCPHCA